MIAAGIVGGLIAAVPGIVDWVAVIPSGTRAKSVGFIHGVGNVLVVGMFAVSWLMRRNGGSGVDMAGLPNTLALILSFGGFVLALATGWLGGELIERLGIAVHADAHPDAPNSLSGRPATDDRLR